MNVIYPRTVLNSTKSDRNVNWSESGFKSRMKPVIDLVIVENHSQASFVPQEAWIDA